MTELESLVAELKITNNVFLLKEDRQVDNIFQKINDILKISKEQILGKKRDGDYVHARYIAIYLVSEQLGSSITLAELGSYFGGRDHSTIIHAKTKILDTTIKTDPKLYTKLKLFNIC